MRAAIFKRVVTEVVVVIGGFTPLARDELRGPRGEGYRRMIELCRAGRGGTPDEIGTGSDFLIDGGVTASYFYGELTPQ